VAAPGHEAVDEAFSSNLIDVLAMLGATGAQGGPGSPVGISVGYSPELRLDGGP
jgi:hypothetical protein